MCVTLHHEVALRVRGILAKRNHAHSVLIDLLDHEIGLAQHESRLHLVDAHLNDSDRALFGHVVGALLVENRRAKILGVALCPVLDLVEGAKVIQVV